MMPFNISTFFLSTCLGVQKFCAELCQGCEGQEELVVVYKDHPMHNMKLLLSMLIIAVHRINIELI